MASVSGINWNSLSAWWQDKALAQVGLVACDNKSFCWWIGSVSFDKNTKKSDSGFQRLKYKVQAKLLKANISVRKQVSEFSFVWLVNTNDATEIQN